MALVSFARQSVIRLRAAMVTDQGVQVPDWSDVDILVIAPAIIQPGGGADTNDNREGIGTKLTVLVNSGSDIIGRDRIEIAGYERPFEIVGEPTLQPSPTGLLDHVVISVTYEEG